MKFLQELHDQQYLDAVVESEQSEHQLAIKTVADIFKKAGKKISLRTDRNSGTNLYAGPFEKNNEDMDILFAAGFRITRTGLKSNFVLRRGNILVVLYGIQKGKKMDSYDVHALKPEDVERKDKEDAEHGASYKGMRFKKWEGD